MPLPTTTSPSARRRPRSLAALAVVAALATNLLAAMPADAAVPADAGRLTSLVDPFVGTAGDFGNDHPGAQAPHGLAKVTPLTTPNRNHAGYDYREDQIAGFTATNLDGVGGSGAGGDLLVVPTTVEYTQRPASNTYAHDYSHDDEDAAPGYYRVGLRSIGGTDSAVRPQSGTIDAQVTATTRTAVQRYAFPAGQTPSLVVDLGNNFTGRLASSVDVASLRDGTAALSGAVEGTFNGANYRLFYYASTTAPVTSVQTWGDGGAFGEEKRRSGTDTGAVLRFAAADAADIGLRITLSPISSEQAAVDQRAELGSDGFDRVRQRTSAEWEQLLESVEISASETSDADGSLKKLFYTHLYRMFATPVNATSTSGTYRGVDGIVHRADGYTYYDGWSSWDDFRKYSVFAYVAPDQYRDMVQSLITLLADTASTGKQLNQLMHSVPQVRWERSAVIIADALSKGFDGFSRLDEAWPSLTDTVGYYSGDQLRQGYVNEDPGVVVQRGYDQWALAIVADEIGRSQDAAQLREQSSFAVKNQIRPGAWTSADGTAVGLLTPRRGDGSWVDVDYEKFEAARLYQGTPWQYTWYGAHDMDGLIAAMGGPAAGRAAIEHMFGEDSDRTDGSTMLHSNANEIDLQAPYLFNYVGEPRLTQKWVRTIYTKESWNRYIATGSSNEIPGHPASGGEFRPPVLRKVYQLDPEGLLPTMDNDAGTMSTMFVAAAVGLFPVTAGSSQYQIGTPFFEKATIRHRDGTSFSVSANGVSPDAYYIQSAQLNGTATSNTWVDYADIVGNGDLSFDMGSSPSTWGADTAPAYSASTATPTPAATARVAPATIAADASGEVSGVMTLTLDTAARFVAAPGTDISGKVTVTGLPSGVSASVVVTAATTAEVRLSGHSTTGGTFWLDVDKDVVDPAVALTGDGLSGRSPLTISPVQIDRSALAALVHDVELLERGNYAVTTFRAMQVALDRARVVLDSPATTSAAVRIAQDALQTAVDALVIDEGGFRRLEAEQSDSWSGGSLVNEAYQSGGNLGGVGDGAWVRYEGLDFSVGAPRSVSIRYANPSAASTVEVRAGDRDGRVIATLTLAPTGSWGNYATVSADLTPEDAAALAAAGSATFLMHAPSGQRWVSNFDWFAFSRHTGDDAPQPPGPVAELTARNAAQTGGGARALNLANGKFENVTAGAWALWRDIDFGGGVDTVTLRIDKPRSRAASDSHVQLRLGAVDGELIADVPLPYTGDGWGTWQEVVAGVDASRLTGRQTLVAVFSSSTQTDAQPYVANIDSVVFTAATTEQTVLEAEAWAANSGNGLKSENSSWNDGTRVTNLGGTYDRAWLDYGTIDFGLPGKNTVAVHYVNNSNRVGRNSAIWLYLDGFDAAKQGEPFAKIPLPVTGTNWSAAGTTTADLPEAITGRHTVHVLLRTDAYADHPYVGNIDNLIFGIRPTVPETHPADVTDLDRAIAEVSALEGGLDRFVRISAATFTRELASARVLVGSGTTSQDDVDDQTRRLRLAASQLVPTVRAELRVLTALAAGVVEGRYTSESWQAFVAARTDATSVLADASSSDEALRGAAQALEAARAALAVMPDQLPGISSAVALSTVDDAVTVTWALVTDDGGTPITGYQVELSDGHRATVADGAQSSVTFAGLVRGSSVSAQVRALNAVGMSSGSASAAPIRVGERSERTLEALRVDALVNTSPPSYAPGAFPEGVLKATYPSDAWSTDSEFLDILSGFRTLPDSALAENARLARGERPTAQNDLIALQTNRAADRAQVARAVTDANNDPSRTMADALGSVLSSAYLAARDDGRLSKTAALFGRVSTGIDQHQRAKDEFRYLRPYVRMGLVGSGGLMRDASGVGYDALSTDGSYPSGHTYAGYTVGTLLATLVPELSAPLLARASEYGDNRVVLGFHYPIDVMGSRMVSQAAIAHRWADPQFAPLLLAARQELLEVFTTACTAAGFDDLASCSRQDAYRGLDVAGDLAVYSQRLSYGFAKVAPGGQPVRIPADAGALLTTAFPDLSNAQRVQILEQTALDSGFPLDATASGDASWQRIDLAAALTAKIRIADDGTVTVLGHTDATAQSVATAAGLTLDGVAVSGFSPDTSAYVIDVPAAARTAPTGRAQHSVGPVVGAVPVIGATATAAGASVKVEEGGHALTSELDGAQVHGFTVTVTSANGEVTRRYDIALNLLPVKGGTGDGGTEPGTGEPQPGDGSTGGTPGGTSGGTSDGSLSGGGPAAGGHASPLADTGGALASGLVPAILMMIALGLVALIEGRRRARRP